MLAKLEDGGIDPMWRPKFYEGLSAPPSPSGGLHYVGDPTPRAIVF